MTKFAKRSLFFLLSILVLDFGVPVKVQLRSGRSATWEEHIRQPRDSSESCEAEWFTERVNCEGLQYTRYDALARRQSNLLADVENQGTCGNCWAFAAAHAFSDFRSLLAGTKMPRLSADYLTRCATEVSASGERYNGCCGDQHARAMMHLKEQGAVSTECINSSLADYIPREISKNDTLVKEFKRINNLTCPATCDNNDQYVAAANRLWAYDFSCDGVSDLVLKGMIYQSGPVVASMMLDKGLFSKYKCGVYCSSDTTDFGSHAVEIVDYGISPLGTPFWVVKNSWGRDWGENGYFRVRMGDLRIGEKDFPISVPLRPGVTPTHGEATESSLRRVELRTCGARAVSNVNSSVLLRCVGEYGLQDLRNRNLFACPDGSFVSNAQLITICSGEIQIIAGSIVNVTLQSQIEGCGENYTMARVSLKVIVNPDQSFSLTDYSIAFNDKRCGAVALIQNSLILILLVFVASFV